MESVATTIRAITNLFRSHRLHLHLAHFVLFALLSSASHAQNRPPPKDIDYKPMISDLNAVALRLENEKLSNSDVAVVAAVGCGAARVALRNRYAADIGPFLRSNFPSPETTSKIALEDFMRSEDILLEKLGASPAGRRLVANTIKVNSKLPAFPPKEDASLNRGLEVLEKESCSLRDQPAKAAAEPAPSQESRTAKCVGKAVVGLTVIVVDVVGSTLLVEMPVAAGILAVISGGWGWNRVEEGCF